MTSRNSTQGRYAGKFKGQHCRTKHAVTTKRYYRRSAEGKPILRSVAGIPNSYEAWRVLQLRKFAQE